MRDNSNQFKKTKWGIGIIIVAMLIGMGYIINVYEIKTITCINQNGETIDWAEMAKGTSLADLPAKLTAVNRNEIESVINHQLNYELQTINFQFPDSLQLYVIEREPSAYMIFNNQQLVLDNYGVVIHSYVLDEPLDQLPLVKGIRMNGYMIGETINTIEPEQLDTLTILINVINNKYAKQGVKQIDISDPLDIYIKTNDEILVKIGRIEHVDEKMKWLAAQEVRAYCLTQVDGYLDLSIVSEPIYRIGEEEKG